MNVCINYDLCLKRVDDSLIILVKDICATLYDQEIIQLAKAQFSFLEDLVCGNVVVFGQENINRNEVDLIIGGVVFHELNNDRKQSTNSINRS